MQSFLRTCIFLGVWPGGHHQEDTGKTKVDFLYISRDSETKNK